MRSQLFALTFLRLLTASAFAATAIANQPLAADSKQTATRYRVYVTNELSGDLTVIDGGSHAVVATIPLGKRPRGLKLAPDRKTLYVALSGSPLVPPGSDESKAPPADKAADGIGVVDLATQRVTRVITGVSDPEQLALSADGKQLYVTSEDSGMLCVIDIRSGTMLAKLAVGDEPEGVTTSPDGKTIYVTSEADSQVSVVDAGKLAVIAKIPVGKRPRVTAFSPDGARAYVTGEFDATVSVIDTHRHVVLHTIKLDGENARPMGVAVAANGKMLYVATGRGGKLVAIDAANYQIRGSAAVGQRPWNTALSPDGATAFTANGPSNDVSVVAVADMKVRKTIAAGDRPWGVIVGALP